VRLLRRIATLVWGEEVDPALRPVLAVTVVSSTAGSAMWSFLAIWAVEELGAKAVILVGQGVMVFYPLVLLAASGERLAGALVMALAGAIGGLGGSVAQAMVADLVAPEKHAPAYASVRVASNLGVVMGPPTGGLMLILGGWTTLFVVVCAMSATAWLLAFRLLPRRGAFAPEGPPERGSFATIVADRPFLLFLGSAVFAWLVYVAYEIVLPVSLVDGYGYAAATWGFLVWINPLLVTLFQIRITRSIAGYPAPPILVAALLTMGLPFLVLVWTQAVIALVLVIVVFVVGEMLWAPTSQAVVAGLAPEDLRGAYMGAFGSAPAIGFALAPLIGFQVRNSFGDDATWVMFAVLAVVAAMLGGIALLGLARRSLDRSGSAVLEA
jgi:predicted MFS family arabinose efflux permease